MHKLTGALTVLMLGVLLAGCGDDNKTASVDTTTTVVSTTTTAAPAPAATAGKAAGGGSSRTTVKQPTGPTPVINSFNTPENIDCHNGNSQTFTASWTTTNAVKVTISIDGAGVYKTYPANGEASLPFNCSSPHTFLLTAYGGGGQTAQKSITLQPRNVQGTDSTEPE